jgi:hypothetical protein
MKSYTILVYAIACLLATTAPAYTTVWAQGSQSSNRAYTEGPVTQVTFVRTKPGMFNQYMQYLQSTYKKEMEAEKSAGIVVSYTTYASDPRDAHDHDLILTVVYKNMAALDSLEDRTDAVANRTLGNTPGQRDTQFIDRGAMREVLGTRLYRELLLK